MPTDKRAKFQISYEPEADVLRVEVAKKPIDYAAELGNIIVFTSQRGDTGLLGNSRGFQIPENIGENSFSSWRASFYKIT